MDVYAFAMKMEKDGEEYYRELAGKSSQGLAKIFNMLADEEVKHYEIVQKLKNKSSLPKVATSGLLKDVKNIFEDMRAGKLEFKQGLYINTTDEASAYRKARDVEAHSREFYLDKATEAKDKEIELLLKKLAAEEDRHYRIVDTIVDFVSRTEPGNWLEDAEWYHLEDY